MPALTSLGIGSGVDINTMLTQLVALERRPLEQMRAEASKLQTKVSGFGQIQSLVSRVQDAANKLKASGGLWQQSQAQSSNEGVVTAVGGSSAAPGNYAVTVTSLASAQTVSSNTAFASPSELVGAGTLTLELGAWPDGAPFAPKAGTSPVALEVTAADTVQSLRDKINALGAGVNATLVTDATGTRLALRSTATGAENGFRIGVADADASVVDGAGLSRVGYDPGAGVVGMVFRQGAANAVATVNDIPVSSASNELSGVVEGLTLRLRGRSASAVDVDVSPDRGAITEAIKGLATAYSELAKYISEQTRYDPGSRVGGPLQGDSAVGGVLSRLRGVINGISGASSAFSRLSDVGLELQRDGTLAVDSAKLDRAMGNLEQLERAFTYSDALVPANEGFARRFATLATDMLAVNGTLSTRTEGLRKLITQNSEKQGRLEDRVERYEQRLVQQFTAMDSNLARLNALNSYVSQQLAGLAASNNGG